MPTPNHLEAFQVNVIRYEGDGPLVHACGVGTTVDAALANAAENARAEDERRKASVRSAPTVPISIEPDRTVHHGAGPDVPAFRAVPADFVVPPGAVAPPCSPTRPLSPPRSPTSLAGQVERGFDSIGKASQVQAEKHAERFARGLRMLGIAVPENRERDLDGLIIIAETRIAELNARVSLVEARAEKPAAEPRSSLLPESLTGPDRMRADWLNAAWRVIEAGRAWCDQEDANHAQELDEAVEAFDSAESMLENYHALSLIDMFRPTKGGAS